MPATVFSPEFFMLSLKKKTPWIQSTDLALLIDKRFSSTRGHEKLAEFYRNHYLDTYPSADKDGTLSGTAPSRAFDICELLIKQESRGVTHAGVTGDQTRLRVALERGAHFIPVELCQKQHIRKGMKPVKNPLQIWECAEVLDEGAGVLMRHRLDRVQRVIQKHECSDPHIHQHLFRMRRY